MRFKKVFLALGLFLGILVSNSFSLEPRLLWKMEIRGVVKAVDFAEISGDIIFSHGKEYPNTITILNKEGKIIWQTGPILERVAISVSISDDGTKFVFLSDFELYKATEKGYQEPYIHYYDKAKGERWRINLSKVPLISPNGKYLLAVADPSEDPYTFLFDETGKVLWKKRCNGAENPCFSPDSKFTVCFPYIIDLSGKVYTDKAYGNITSITENAEYFGLEGISPEKEGIYTKNGELIFNGKNIISPNGKTVVKCSSSKIEIYRFPEISKIREFPIKVHEKFGYTRISYDGKFIAIVGSEKQSKSKIFFINVETGDIRGTEIPDIETSKMIYLFITQDGKNLCLWQVKEANGIIYYYQTY